MRMLIISCRWTLFGIYWVIFTKFCSENVLFDNDLSHRHFLGDVWLNFDSDDPSFYIYGITTNIVFGIEFIFTFDEIMSLHCCLL